MGMKMPSVLYFDDYGRLEATESKHELEMMGMKTFVHTLNIQKDGYMYNIDLVEKTGTKTKVPTGMVDAKGMDFSKLTESMMKEMEITQGGHETVLGKKCDVFEMDSKKMGIKGRFLVWENIMLKSESEMGTIKVLSMATKMEDNVSVPADKFMVPSDIEITEY